MTFFVRDLNHNIKKTYGLEVENFNEYPHYYFTIEFMKKSMKDEKYLDSIISNGKDRAIKVTEPVLSKIYEIIGFFRD